MGIKTYNIHEIFYSLQGEGANAGLPVVFVRFSGCNLHCDFCDTERVKGVRMTKEQILKVAQEQSDNCKRVVFTGGEPLLQLDLDLVAWFLTHCYWIAIETNGTLAPPAGIHYVTLSPKKHSTIHPFWSSVVIDELRIPLANNELPYIDLKNVKQKFISPVFDGQLLVRENLDWAINYCLQHPSWKLSVQQHKLFNIK